MEMKVLWAGLLIIIGWLFYYLIGRQFVFNFSTVFPLIKKMNKTQENLISENANRYTIISAIVCGFFLIAVVFLCIRFLPQYLWISFLSGMTAAAIMFIGKLSPENKDMFDSFCGTYYRFIFDDQLRTHMYNKKPSSMKIRLHDMGLSTEFIPDFKEKNNK